MTPQWSVPLNTSTALSPFLFYITGLNIPLLGEWLFFSVQAILRRFDETANRRRFPDQGLVFFLVLDTMAAPR